MIPQTLNGFPVEAVLPRLSRSGFRDGTYAVLVHRPDHELHQWVTAVWSKTCEDTWLWGHYFEDRADAMQDLRERAGLP